MSKYGIVFRFGVNLGSGARNVTKLKFLTAIMLKNGKFHSIYSPNSQLSCPFFLSV